MNRVKMNYELVSTKRVLITPAKAGKLLSTSPYESRQFDVDKAIEYAEDMELGNWDMPDDIQPEPYSAVSMPFRRGGPISVVVNGIVIDGQHRLWAVIESGVSIWAWIETYRARP
jgi:hypothetical protein